MPLIVHHLNNSRSQRILWLLEELALDYEIRRYERDAVSNLAPEELRAIHPLGKSPVLEDDGRIISESGAIVEYICRCHGGQHLVPAVEDASYIRYLEFLHFAEGSAMTPILLNLYTSRLGDAGLPLRARIDQQLELHFQYMEDALAQHPFFAGDDFSASDIMMSFPAEVAVMNGGPAYPRLAAFVDACHARPAWQRARERGGSYFIF
ncbi:glutathione S-transferase family protein [Sphingopyxis yananensis]|uniref:glutathione S-transferase family protein n=1 Tax=Sphingopyxis yananensis TaxID=2886687 RepID=UPI001D11BEEF|nr:glutathione S-transferase [Sphingopyxis yananensis]MCC2603366.1 glutathione S-transferase [Sphingopyxis yananensis]